MVTSPTFESYSQNGEDVVLWRALRAVEHGRYIDVGANHPKYLSISRAFYERGWSGIAVEPDPEFANLQREERPRDTLIEAAATAEEGGNVTLHVVDSTGLSTLDRSLAQIHAESGFDTHDLTVPTRRIDAVLAECGWAGQDIHYMSVDTEGSERQVLEGIDLTVWRPWILVIEATAPLSTDSTRDRWETVVTDAGYQLCLFDGLSCFYVAEEHTSELQPLLSYPACPHDDYITLEARECAERAAAIPGLVEEVSRWRAQAMTRWATAVANTAELLEVRDQLAEVRRQFRQLQEEHHQLFESAGRMHQQIVDLHESTSWRVTKPLRAATTAVTRSRRG